MSTTHKHHLALAITIIIVWNTLATRLATEGLEGILANCTSPTATLRTFSVLTLIIAAILILSARAIRQVAIAEVTVRITGNVKHARLQFVVAIGVRRARVQVGVTT